MRDFCRISALLLFVLTAFALAGAIDKQVLDAQEMDHPPSVVWTYRPGVPDDGIERIEDVRHMWLVADMEVCR